MRRCGKCRSLSAQGLAPCSDCGASPELRNGVATFCSQPPDEGQGFRSSYFQKLAEIEAGHFWFRARNNLILWALQKYAPDAGSFLEIGCGTGFVLSGMAKRFPNMRFFGSELYVAGLTFAAERTPQASFLQMDACDNPFVAEFDAIGTFDVLEHIQHDALALGQIHTALKPGGLLLLTVPQHAWLWSASDDDACHKRRYNKAGLHTLLLESGFEILLSTSFVSVLLPAMLASRMAQRILGTYDPLAEFRINPQLNCLFEAMLGCESWLISLGLNFPFGGSRLVVAHKLG